MIDGDVVTIGSPNVSHGLSLKQGPWLDPETVLGAIHRYPTTRRIDKFYGQSWVYVHYLQNTPELSAKLPVYLKLLKEKKDPLQAFETGFGLSVEEFHKRARVYWNKNLFSVASYQDLYLMISQAAMMGEDYKRAKTYLTKAIKTGKINSQLLHQRADLAYHKLVSEQFENVPDDAVKIFKTDKALSKAVQYFEEAFMLKEGNRTIDMHLLDLLGRSSSPVSEASYAKGRVDEYEDKTKNDDAARLIKFEQDFPSLCD